MRVMTSDVFVLRVSCVRDRFEHVPDRKSVLYLDSLGVGSVRFPFSSESPRSSSASLISICSILIVGVACLSVPWLIAFNH